MAPSKRSVSKTESRQRQKPKRKKNPRQAKRTTAGSAPEVMFSLEQPQRISYGTDSSSDDSDDDAGDNGATRIGQPYRAPSRAHGGPRSPNVYLLQCSGQSLRDEKGQEHPARLLPAQ